MNLRKPDFPGSPLVTIGDFLTDAETIMERVAGDQPILVGGSLGADLAVWYAASHPGRVAGLFLIDGAVPVNLVTDPEDLRRRLDTPAMYIGPLLLYLVGKGYRLLPFSEPATLARLLDAFVRLCQAGDQREVPNGRGRISS